MIKTDRFGKYLGGKQGGKVIQQATEDALYTTYQKTPDSPANSLCLNAYAPANPAIPVKDLPIS